MSTALCNKIAKRLLAAIVADQDAHDVRLLAFSYEDRAARKWGEYSYLLNLVAWNKFGTW